MKIVQKFIIHVGYLKKNSLRSYTMPVKAKKSLTKSMLNVKEDDVQRKRPELVFLKLYGAQESMPRHQLRQPM